MNLKAKITIIAISVVLIIVSYIMIKNARQRQFVVSIWGTSTSPGNSTTGMTE